MEVFSAGMRPEEEGELCDLLTYKLLTPRLSPGCLPESSQKLRAKHYIWTLSVWPRHALSLEVLAWMSVHLGEGPRAKARRDERYWGWIVLMIKIKHTPWTFSPSCILFHFPPPILHISFSLHPPKIGDLINKWETCWQLGAKWIWVMGSWSMCLFNHLVATPSILWWSVWGGKESSPDTNAHMQCWFDRVRRKDSSQFEWYTSDELIFTLTFGSEWPRILTLDSSFSLSDIYSIVSCNLKREKI